MIARFKYFTLIGVFLLANRIDAQVNQFVQENTFICFSCNQIQINEKLENALKKLHSVRLNNLKVIQKNYPNQSDNLTSISTTKYKETGNDTLFTIMQIGDSHVQGDYFSGEIRIQLQSRFGNAGRGILFPYALAKSFGPKGVSVKPIGRWLGLKTMSQSLSKPLGIAGYAAYTNSAAASFAVSLTEKFREENDLGTFSSPEIQKIRIWHSAGVQSFKFNLNADFKRLDTFVHSSGWGYSTFLSNVPQNQFYLNLQKVDSNQDQFAFYGFELLPSTYRGLAYHHCGVVGAQFPHLIHKATYSLEQIATIKPDILVFSFGTNEAYNGKLDTAVYAQTIMKFIDQIHDVSPNTAIIFTTPPDTRSNNRIPQHQRNVIQQFYRIANEKNVLLYDLNAAMGGWGSMYHWHKNKLTISDKLHFNPSGYALQGQLFTLALLQAYNRINAQDTLNTETLRNHIFNTLVGLSSPNNKVLLNDSLSLDTNQIKPVVPEREFVVPEHEIHRNSIHIVKRGETIYSIGRKYQISPNKIIKLNQLKKSKKIKPGQKLKIPKG